jgi:hypothetical protein
LTASKPSRSNTPLRCGIAMVRLPPTLIPRSSAT